MSGSFDVTIRQGNQASRDVQTDTNLLPLLETVVEDGKSLQIRWKRGTSVRTRTTPAITRTVVQLQGLASSGDSHIRVTGLQTPQPCATARHRCAGHHWDNGGMSLAPAAHWRHPEFRQGAKDMVSFGLGVGAWGMVTGVAMVKSGMGVGAAVAMSLMVFAGSAQLAAAPLIAIGAPIWVVWATALCLNLRFVIFSAQWRPYLKHLPRRQRAAISFFCADLNFVHFMRRYPAPEPAPGQVPYFWGGVLVNAGAWHVMSLVGIALGNRVPEAWGLGFAGTVSLLALSYSLLSNRSTWLPAVVAGSAAVAAYALPMKLNMLVAIAAAVAVGAVIDHLPRLQRAVAR